jgi:hypothetical protein
MADGYSLSMLVRERAELQKDEVAFKRAYDILRARLQESNESEIARRPLLHEWSGSRSVCGALEMSIHAIERTIHEMGELIRKINDGDVPNIDPPGHPGLGVIDGGKV